MHIHPGICVYLHVYVAAYLYIYHLALFYYTLGNISPKYRSSIRCIQLVAVVKSTILQKYGADAILEPFMADIRSLEQVQSLQKHTVAFFHVFVTQSAVCRMKE